MRALARLLKLAILLALVAGAGVAYDARTALDAPLRLTQPATVEIASGSSLAGVLADVQARGVLPWRTALYLRGYGRLTGRAASVKAGEYELAPGQTARGMLEQFVAGKVKLHELVLVEGWSFKQALRAVADAPALRHTLDAAATPEAVMQAIGQPGVHPEGRFLPETYRFPRGMTDVAFLRRAFEAMEAALAREWAQRDPGSRLASPQEALILASIVEKETGLASERALIAGVFLRRLERNMRLQTDPTVIYGLGERFDGDLRRIDLETDSPYNSYLRAGLPPTPICLPGVAAIRATLHPAPTEALYFVSRGDGSHHFSATLEEHAAAVRKYQLGQR